MNTPISMNLNSAQRAAISATGNVLVVAGAGTGKTRTLVERCLQLVLDGSSLEQLLMVTFTEAAAAEMRMRLRSALEERAAAEPCNDWIREQLALLDGAPICTLHSFCLDLIREHFHELELDPQIVVLDERQTQPLVEQSLDAVVNPQFEAHTDQAEALRGLLTRTAGDATAQLRELVLKLHRYAQSLPDPERWIAEQLSGFADPQPERWRRGFVQEFSRWYPGWLARLDSFRSNKTVAACLAVFEQLPHQTLSFELIRSTLEEVYQQDQVVGWKHGTKGKCRDPLKGFFDDAVALRNMMTGLEAGGDPLQGDWDQVRPLMTALLTLTQRFGSAYTRSKRELGGVDFSDLEQLSLRLLWKSEGTQSVPSETALRTQVKFTHVFVDEVQDINTAQDAILRAVSREDGQGNRFLVGDVKQSIYRFRLANPAIFRDYEHRWRRADGPGTVIDLNENFRSREGVLEVINSIFALSMHPELGGVSYDESARLRFGNPEARVRLRHRDAPCVELRVITSLTANEDDLEEGGTSKPFEDLQVAEREARWVAHRLRALHQSAHLVWDDTLKEFRGVRWSDMVVLLRSPGAKTEVFAKEFHTAGVPLAAPRGGFFAAQEVLDLLSLLQLLDNPLQDIPLLAVLRSPLFGFSLEELAEIRVTDRRVRFWTALAVKSRSTEYVDRDLVVKIRHFLGCHERWRELIRLGSISSCLETMLADTRYEALLESQARGRERGVNLHRFLELARQFDPYQRQGLFRFLRFVEAQIEHDQDLDVAPVPASDAVRVMSIHRSKGLEFPIVVVADLGKRFNMGDLNQDILLDEEFGLCPRAWIPGTRIKYSTLPRWMASRRGQRELRGEELRLLYVALTRARDLLILVGTGSAKDWTLQSGDTEESPAPSPIEGRLRAERALSALQWIAPWFQATTLPNEWTNTVAGANKLLRWCVGELVPGELIPEPLASKELIHEIPREALNLESVMPEVLRKMNWRYGHDASTREPVKTTVSVLRHRHAEDSESVCLFPTRLRRTASSAKRDPATAVSATERGNLHHLFLQWLDLGRAETALDLRNEAERMRQSGLLTQEQVALLEINALADFWQSDVGRRIRGARRNVHRELPFTARMSAQDLRDLGVMRSDSGLQPDEFVVVQGQVDLAVVFAEEIWVFDLKTDTVSAEDAEARAAEYRVQVQIYALALERVYRKPVTARWLHFLSAGVTVSVPSV